MFAGRAEAGAKLAEMLADFAGGEGIVLAIPAGGVAVGAALAKKLGLAFDVAVVSKILLPWTTEAGFGAAAFDGTVRLNKHLLTGVSLTKEQIEKQTKAAVQKVQRRVKQLRPDRPMPRLSGRCVILVDDGIASGFTMRVAAEAVGNCGAREIIVAVPTAHEQALRDLEKRVSAVYCANVRSGYMFAVAEAYRNWYDVGEKEAAKLLGEFENDSV